MGSRKRLSVVLPLIALVLLCLVLLTYTAMRDRSVFRLRKVSAFDLVEDVPSFGRGQQGTCADVPDANVTAYPAFRSTQPIYGAVRFGQEPGRQDSGIRFCFALDESGGTGSGYDRLYFDRNRDLDLTNDGVCKRLERRPKGVPQLRVQTEQQPCYEYVKVPLPFGAQGERPLEVMPRLIIYESGFKGVQFITTQAREGRVKVAGRKFDVFLGHGYAVPGWFDHPWTALYLKPRDERVAGFDTWGGDRLMAMHQIGGTLYRFSATPAGDKLTVVPYEGPMGTFAVGAGSRDLDAPMIRGWLSSRETSVVVGRWSERSGLIDAESSRVPVGDYLLDLVTVTYGSLRIGISDNYHSDGRRQSIRQDRPRKYSIHICADQPFVLDFSAPPEVMFAAPARDQRVPPGDDVQVMAVLTDPVLDTMIRRLDVVEEAGEGVSLDPKVTVTRADGEVVAEGVMPFG